MSKTIDFGIDLGTTNSCIARCEVGDVRIFGNNDQMQVTPSAVHINRSRRRVVGLRALLALRTDPENVATEFKRLMGQRSPHRFKDAGLTLSPEELSAEVLKSLREDVRRQTGVELSAAVITVPAAFGTLQCEATARAAKLAGIEEVHLLQEPIAAAIGYGVKPQQRNQHWLVFDLGGGTLDIAVISTRAGRLNVLEHQGNNLRGGKDIDRAIVEQIFLPAIAEQFDVAPMRSQGFSHPLLQKLRTEAERAKIALSTDSRVSVYLSDVGEDASGKPIEMELTVTQDQLATLVKPLLEECIALARQALTTSRTPADELDRILLVGGPTQMPLIRSQLSEQLGAPVDFSVDPMTVVARGAALYAATLTRGTVASTPPAVQLVQVKLAYEPVSAELTCPLEGKIESDLPGLQVKLETASGTWTSGWLSAAGSVFKAELPLNEGELNLFLLSLRDGRGQLLETDTPEFKVRNGLVPATPFLPHSISVEIAGPQGKPTLDVVFARNTLLPAGKQVLYRASHALVPGKKDSNIYIKLREGEFLETPDANKLIAILELIHEGVKQRVPEGSEIEVTVKIDQSRLVTVEAFLPVQQAFFSNQIYIPRVDDSDYPSLAADSVNALPELTDTLQDLSDRTRSMPEFKEELEEIRTMLSNLVLSSSFVPAEHRWDMEEATRFVTAYHDARGRIFRVLRRTEGDPEPSPMEGLDKLRTATDIVNRYGDAFDKQALESLTSEYGRAVSAKHSAMLEKIAEEFVKLRYRVLERQESYWKQRFEYLQEHSHPFADPVESEGLIKKGRLIENDCRQLKEVVRALWLLLPEDVAKQYEVPGVRK
jgi:molecular chaperone DnaK